MKKIIEILKGAVMGIANVIPGLSGGTIAVATGIYEKLINALNDVVKHPIKVIKEIWPIVLGIVLGILSSVIGVTYLLEHHEVPTTALFIGFIIGSLPIIIKDVENKKITKNNIIAFICMLVLVMILPILELCGIKIASANTNPILLGIIGMLAAATMIVPGVSGSMLLMTLGYYETIMSKISGCILALKSLDFATIFSNVLFLIPFGIGIIVGFVLVAKLMKWLFSKFRNTTNWAILGLIVASPFAIITKMDMTSVSIVEVIVALFTLAIGYGIAWWLCKKDVGEKK